MRRFKVVSQNVQHLPLMNKQQVEHDVELTYAQADIIGWQEMQNNDYAPWYWDILRKYETKGWETYAGVGKPKPGRPEKDDPQKVFYSTPISWKTDLFEFVEGGRFILNEGHTKISGTRWLTWVKLRVKKTGREFYVVNVHLVAGAFNKSRPDRALRLAIWRESVRKLRDWVRTVDGPLILTGDFNARREPLLEFFKGFRILFPTRIDHVIVRGKKIRVLWIRTLLNRIGDHPGALAVLRFRRSRSAK